MARPTAQTLRWIKSLVKRGDAKVEAFAHYANQEVLITGNATQEPLVDVGATESERKKAIHVWSRGFTRCLQTPRNSIAVLNHANRPLSTYSITCQVHCSSGLLVLSCSLYFSVGRP